MLNWEDPLADLKPQRPFPLDADAYADADAESPSRPKAEPSDWRDRGKRDQGARDSAAADSSPATPRPGLGLVANSALMATAGAAPVVNPNPLPMQATLLPEEDDSAWQPLDATPARTQAHTQAPAAASTS
jgi:ribonucleoside-diphosphate reductase beta chain